MDIEGTYTLHASPEVVWKGLSNQQVLTRLLPEIEWLTPIDDRRLAITLNLRHSLLRGVYSGIITLVERQEPYYCRIEIEGDEQATPFSGSGMLQLLQRDHTTVITYRGNVQIGKAETRLAQVIARGATKMVIQRLLSALTCQLQESGQIPIPEAEKEIVAVGTRKLHLPGGALVILPPAPTRAASLKEGIAQMVTQKATYLLHLNAADAKQTELWKKRMRRISVAGVLLFLVWVGTRIPRRL